MEIGGITEYIDVAQITLYVFWVFFALLIIYLIQENKREGYPLETDELDPASRRKIAGITGLPSPKTFLMPDGTKYIVPDLSRADTNVLKASGGAVGGGFPIDPDGDPMLAEVGPGSYTKRDDVPDLNFDGSPKIIPMRSAQGFHVDERDPNPIGMDVVGADNEVGATVTDVWVDPSEHLIRFVEADVGGGKRVLFPLNLTTIEGQPLVVKVRSLLSAQFVNIPITKSQEQITRLEEEKIYGYFGAGTLYATPRRSEPLI